MPLNMAAFAECANMSREAHYVLSHGLASYVDLKQHLTLEDVINLIESHQVAEHNRSLMEELQRELSNR